MTNNALDMAQFATGLQSDKVKDRAKRRENPFKCVRKAPKVRGVCLMCRQDCNFYHKTYELCHRCELWAKRFLKKKYGYFHRSKLGEAIVDFHKEVKCRFNELCGNNRPRLRDGKINNIRVCDKCYVIWKHGYTIGRNQTRNRRLTSSVDLGDRYGIEATA